VTFENCKRGNARALGHTHSKLRWQKPHSEESLCYTLRVPFHMESKFIYDRPAAAIRWAEYNKGLL